MTGFVGALALAMGLAWHCGGKHNEGRRRCEGEAGGDTIGSEVACAIEYVRASLPEERISPAAPFLAAIRRASDSLGAALDGTGRADACVDALIDLIYSRWEIGFDPNQDDLLSLLPNTVVERKRGSCLGVSLLLLMLAERIDCPLTGVLLPGHFFVRYERDSVRRNIEPNRAGCTHPDSYYRERYGVAKGSWYAMHGMSKAQALGVFYYNLGNIYRLRGRPAEAVQCYRRTVEAIGDYGEAWGNLGITYEQMGKTDSARASFERALELRPGLANLGLNLGTFELHHKDYARAVKSFRAGLEHFPGDLELLYGLGLAYYGIGMLDSCRAVLGAMKQLSAGSLRVHQLDSLVR